MGEGESKVYGPHKDHALSLVQSGYLYCPATFDALLYVHDTSIFLCNVMIMSLHRVHASSPKSLPIQPWNMTKRPGWRYKCKFGT